MVRLLILWIYISCVKASTPFSLHEQTQEQKQYIEQIDLKYRGADELLRYQKNFPKSRIIPSLNGNKVTLFSFKQEEINLIKNFIREIDVPAESICITLYCLLIQEQYLDDFLSSVLTNNKIIQLSWSDLMKSLLVEMQRNGQLIVVAAPKIAMIAGQEAMLKATEEFNLKTNDLWGKDERRQLGVEVKLRCMLKPNEIFSFDINLSHYTSPLGQASQQLLNKDQLQTHIQGKKGDMIFLGSVGRWTSASEEGRFSLLSFLPMLLNPSLKHSLQTTSQMILLAALE
jgi:type II secretory pathway component GspD/PulD (secretin)